MMVLLKDYLQFQKTKDIFFRFCNHFKQLNHEEVLSDGTFINYHKTVMQNDPDLTEYAYQFALEVTYARRLFSQEEINHAFNGLFTVQDLYGLNNGACDASTLNTAFITNILKTRTVFKDANFVVASTPLEYQTDRYYNIQKGLGSLIQQSKLATGNTNCDIFLDGRPYDIKHTVEDHVSQSHILCWSNEKFNMKINSHLKNMLDHITQTLMKKTTTNIKFFLKAQQVLKDIVNTKELTLQEKNTKWHKFIHENSSNIPPDFNYSLVFPMTTTDFTVKTPKHIMECLQLPMDVIENKYKAHKAIIGIIALHDAKTKKCAKIATYGLVDAVAYTLPDSVD